MHAASLAVASKYCHQSDSISFQFHRASNVSPKFARCMIVQMVNGQYMSLDWEVTVKFESPHSIFVSGLYLPGIR